MTSPFLSEPSLSVFPYYLGDTVDPSVFDVQDSKNLVQDTKRVRRKQRRRKTAFKREAENQPATDLPQKKKQKKDLVYWSKGRRGRPSKSRSTQDMQVIQDINVPRQSEAFLNTDVTYTPTLNSDYFNIEETFLKSPTYRPLYMPLLSDAVTTPTKRSVHRDIYTPLTKGFLGLHDEIQALLSPLVVPPIDPVSPSPSADASPCIPFNPLFHIGDRAKAKASA